MAVEIQATGFVGIAFEAVAGTYVAPTKFFPFRSESLSYNQETIYRRVIRGIADRIGAVMGKSSVAGDIELEALHTVMPYFMYAMRGVVVKTGAGPFIYTGTPGHGANPTAGRTLSVTIVKNGVVFAFTGCIVSSLTLGADSDDGILVATVSLVGRNEASQAVPTPTFDATVPFGHGSYTIGNPTGITVNNVNSFEAQVEDSGVAEHRLSNTRAPQFVRFGERTVGMTMAADFESKAEYDEYKAGTARSVRVLATNGTHSVQITIPVAIKDSYDVSGLGSQGDLVSASVEYEGMYDPATTKAYEIVVVTTESIT